MRGARTVSQAKQGQGTIWGNLEHRKLTWKELWEMEAGRIILIIRATYDVLPIPNNLNQCAGEDPSCPVCKEPATLRHILTVKPVFPEATIPGHNQVLRQLASILEQIRTATNAFPSQTTGFYTTAFAPAGQLMTGTLSWI